MTAPNEYEPSGGQVEKVRDEFAECHGLGFRCSREIAMFILRRQHARERGLLGAVKAAMEYLPAFPSTAGARLAVALAAHAKLDAPKVPTLLEAADALVRSACANKPQYSSVGTAEYQALKAAVEREEKR